MAGFDSTADTSKQPNRAKLENDRASRDLSNSLNGDRSTVRSPKVVAVRQAPLLTGPLLTFFLPKAGVILNRSYYLGFDRLKASMS